MSNDQIDSSSVRRYQAQSNNTIRVMVYDKLRPNGCAMNSLIGSNATLSSLLILGSKSLFPGTNKYSRPIVSGKNVSRRVVASFWHEYFRCDAGEDVKCV